MLWGAGGTFCAGADLHAMSNALDPDIVFRRADGTVAGWRCRKPVIAAVSGHAVAGGLELALWCDLRVVESDAVFGVFCRRWGVPLIDGGTVRLPRIVGLGRALDLILTGRAVGADEALAIGLANRVVAPGAARAAAEALAAQIAAFPQALPALGPPLGLRRARPAPSATRSRRSSRTASARCAPTASPGRALRRRRRPARHRLTARPCLAALPARLSAAS